MTKLRTHYDNLKVARDAPDLVIRAAYRTLSQKYHPDKNPGDARAARVMAILNQSYDVLSDPERRREHDGWIEREESKFKQRAQAQSPPIPPMWQPPPSPERQSPVKRGRNIFVALLLLPFKLVLGIFQAAPQLALWALIIGGIWLWIALTPDRPRPPPPSGPKPYQTEAPARPEPVPAKPAYVRPAAAPNGSPWPNRAAYVRGYPVDHDDGHSDITVDNTRNDSDVFVKLVSLDTAAAYPVRQFYIPAGAKFRLDDVTAGEYDIRYRDLATGGLSRSEPFEVEETRTYDGIQYSTMTMTLYKVQDGNFQTYDLGEDEF